MTTLLGIGLLSIGSLIQAPLWVQVVNGPTSHNGLCTVREDEIEVFIDSLGGGTNQTVLVTKTTAMSVDVDYINLQLAVRGQGIPPEVRTDFKDKNKSSCLIEPFSGIVNIRFISEIESDRLFLRGWSEFRKKYGRNASLVYLSRVGFNADKTLALVHVSSGIGPMAAGGALYLLEKKKGKWVIKSSMETWTT